MEETKGLKKTKRSGSKNLYTISRENAKSLSLTKIVKEGVLKGREKRRPKMEITEEKTRQGTDTERVNRA